MSVSSATPRNTTTLTRSERMLILGSSLMVISILSIVTFLLIRERGSAEMAATRAASNIVQLIDADVLRNVELYDVSLRGLISASQRDDLKQVSPTIRHMALFDRATAAPYKGNILLLDSRGDVLADSASVEPRQGNFSDREYFQSHVNNPDPGMLISRPFRARPPELDWRISFSRRVSGEHGEFLGVAEAAMRLDYFSQLFKSLNVGRDSSVNLISSDGILLAQEPPRADNLIGQDFSQRPNFIRILREGNGSFKGMSSTQQPRLYTFSQVGDLPLIVIVALSSNEVFASWQRTALVVGGATGALCLGLLWLTWLLCRELRRRQSAEQELAQLAATDALTGLDNRRSLDQTLAREWGRAQRSHSALSLLMLDVDHFKAFNDRHGHPLGDEALRIVARVISDNIRRPGDLAARYGGEEFAVVLPETDNEGARRIAEHIRLAIERLPPIRDGASPITISIGLSTWAGTPKSSLEALCSMADKALYQAKAEGRNRVVAG
ncbi:sensor domain-containing diguanylate cyclase [Pseudomonas chlororaphis]|uniref:sensor domain-containing diguanylate cyclase n=2 Tax=Pseudomonas chlororaphis TaxID=587753 RepID=UPI000E0AC47A|nr:sensor domain-containing diguanylate cyclase [Pseudomonas chlororaphis]WDH21780.1 sensor domain-containing diguanylate cyclase [Pseudomonas chlororaphis]WDH46409.1 sensor domain-containing diguanylate cyclase [Pseudomonas chlororaphis]WDH58256.1 sensor domain-containing diguanylate cyclase [Pseudomonas chlororaphis]WQE17512.1 sensor domain-containing diguanylate cyclase [Pseudomonas chlororaphis]